MKNKLIFIKICTLLTIFSLFSCTQDVSKTSESPTTSEFPATEPVVTTFTVSFNSMGGSEVTSQTIESGKKASRPINPKKESSTTYNYKFIGWFISTDGGKTFSEQQFDFETKITSNITLYAKWTEELRYYTISYYSDYGSVPTSITIQVNTILNSEQLPNISTVGQTFSGWFDGDTKVIPGEYKVTKDVILTARWNVVNHTVTFQPNNGKETISQTVVHGSKLTIPTTPIKAATVSTSYTFAGWYTSSDNGITLSNTTFDFANTIITAQLTLYAKWTETPVYYTVTFDSKGGSSVTSLQLRWGDTINKPSNPIKEQFGLTSYAFDNWYTSTDNGITLSNTAFDFVNSTITKSITLYAKWIESQSEYQFHEIVEYLPSYTNGTAGTSSKYVLFGDWPQTIKAANVTVNENQSMTMGDFTYYKGSDGYWYAKCTENASASNPIYYDGTPVAKASANSFKYFKVEPIKWRILNPYKTDTEKPFLLAERILTAHCYATKETSGQGKNYYQYSEIRTYLNTTFLNGGFTTNAQNLIQKTRYDNSARSTNPASNATLWNNGENPNTCPNNPDKIFLLSEQEVTKSAYGFAEYNKKDITRIRVPTDYAKANGCGGQDSQTSVGYSGSWWLRSPYYDPNTAVHEVNSYGYADTGWYADSNYNGVVPALCLN